MDNLLKFIIIVLVTNQIVNTTANSTVNQPLLENFQWSLPMKPLYPYGTDVGDFQLSNLKKVPYATYDYNTGSDVIHLHGGKLNRLSIMEYLPLVHLSTYIGSMTLSHDRCARIAPFTYLFCSGGSSSGKSSDCKIVSDIVPRIPDNLWAQEYQALGVRDRYETEKVTTFVRKTRDREILQEIAKDIVTTYPDQFWGRFSLEWALIITWMDVQFFREPFHGSGTNVTVSPRSTYQVALTSTSVGHMTFVVVNHEKIDWNFEEIRENVHVEQSIDRIKKELKDNCKEANLNEVSGRFIYRLDNALAFKETDVMDFDCPLRKNYSEAHNFTERVRISPHIINILLTSYITLEVKIDGVCFRGLDEKVRDIGCSLQDGAGNLEYFTTSRVFRSDKQRSIITSCQNRASDKPFKSLGRQTLKLEVFHPETRALHTFYGHVYVVQLPPELFQATVDENKHELSITWDRNIFSNTFIWRQYSSAIPAIKELPPVSVSFKWLEESDMTFHGRWWTNNPKFSNSGCDRITGVTDYLFLNQDELVLAILQQEANEARLYSPVRRIVKKADKAVDACLKFINSSSEKFGFPDDTEVCPPTLDFAKKDPKFEALSGHLENSFRQRVPAPSGAASVCSYNKTNGHHLLVGYPAGATSLRFHPAYDYWKNQLKDEISKELCCSDGNDDDNCRTYYNKRPSKDSTGYVIPRAARAVGAGHITTFDDAKHTLAGVGEFLLMDYKSPKVDGIFLKVQVRMKQYLNSRGIKRKASVFTAFAMEESRAAGETIRIQVEDKGVGSGIHVMLDGEPMHVDLNQLLGTEKKFMLSWKSVLLSKTLDGNEVEVTFASGFTFRFKSVSPKEMGLNLMVMGSCLRDNVRFSYEDIEMSGLLGDCDHNPENDFKILKNTEVSEQDKVLGLPWKILSSEHSIFTYDGDAESFDSYEKAAPYKSDFNLTDAIHSDYDGNLKLICGNQENCMYDLQTTYSVLLAQATKASNDEFEKLRLFYTYATGICSNGENETFTRGWTQNAYDLVQYLPDGKQFHTKCFPGYEMEKSRDLGRSCDCNDKGEWKCTGGEGLSCIRVEMEPEENATEAVTDNTLKPSM